MREFQVKIGDVLLMPDGERWYVTRDDSSHLFWLSSKPRREDSPLQMPVIPGTEGRLS